ncbi:MAG: YifB family Mg chelatase-like AAA ATPase [Gammaproteobacteria bacterium]
MSLAIVYSRAPSGIQAPLVTVEVHLSNGMAAFNIVGLPEAAVKESRDRVRSALMNMHFEFPCRRITVNLAPADLPKEGGRFDLPIALGILAATGQLSTEILTQYEFAGELALSGEIRSVRGILPAVLAAHQANRQSVVPMQNAEEAALVEQANVLPAKHLSDVCAHLQGEVSLASAVTRNLNTEPGYQVDMSDVKGQMQAKRALEIAAAGRHSLLFIGPPGTGKTMLASRLPTILPGINQDEALAVAAVSSVSSNGFDSKRWGCIPFRAPHHSSSSVALVGGGRPPKPGEISLAHHGVLFLDELPEFNRHVLECLREPLESGEITISRAAFQTVFPANFQFMAAMNPCPCGYATSAMDECRCNPEQIKRYMGKISGPLLDRIDMHVEVARMSPDLLAQNNAPLTSDTSAVIRERVKLARNQQLTRQLKCNALLTVPELERHSGITQASERLLIQVMNKFNLSARIYHRIVKVARTIADLAGSEGINEGHLSEALQYRSLDRIKSGL